MQLGVVKSMEALRVKWSASGSFVLLGRHCRSIYRYRLHIDLGHSIAHREPKQISSQSSEQNKSGQVSQLNLAHSLCSINHKIHRALRLDSTQVTLNLFRFSPIEANQAIIWQTQSELILSPFGFASVNRQKSRNSHSKCNTFTTQLNLSATPPSSVRPTNTDASKLIDLALVGGPRGRQPRSAVALRGVKRTPSIIIKLISINIFIIIISLPLGLGDSAAGPPAASLPN